VLTGVKGIGVWTAQMFLIFALRNLYGLPELPKPAQVEELARNWRPYSTVASWYLWRSLEV
jgi:DNA-3-methyladenine glycosylase II